MKNKQVNRTLERIARHNSLKNRITKGLTKATIIGFGLAGINSCATDKESRDAGEDAQYSDTSYDATIPGIDAESHQEVDADSPTDNTIQFSGIDIEGSVESPTDDPDLCILITENYKNKPGADTGYRNQASAEQGLDRTVELAQQYSFANITTTGMTSLDGRGWRNRQLQERRGNSAASEVTTRLATANYEAQVTVNQGGSTTARGAPARNRFGLVIAGDNSFTYDNSNRSHRQAIRTIEDGEVRCFDIDESNLIPYGEQATVTTNITPSAGSQRARAEPRTPRTQRQARTVRRTHEPTEETNTAEETYTAPTTPTTPQREQLSPELERVRGTPIVTDAMIERMMRQARGDGFEDPVVEPEPETPRRDYQDTPAAPTRVDTERAEPQAAAQPEHDWLSKMHVPSAADAEREAEQNQRAAAARAAAATAPVTRRRMRAKTRNVLESELRTTSASTSRATRELEEAEDLMSLIERECGTTGTGNSLCNRDEFAPYCRTDENGRQTPIGPQVTRDEVNRACEHYGQGCERASDSQAVSTLLNSISHEASDDAVGRTIVKVSSACNMALIAADRQQLNDASEQLRRAREESYSIRDRLEELGIRHSNHKGDKSSFKDLDSLSLSGNYTSRGHSYAAVLDEYTRTDADRLNVADIEGLDKVLLAMPEFRRARSRLDHEERLERQRYVGIRSSEGATVKQIAQEVSHQFDREYSQSTIRRDKKEYQNNIRSENTPQQRAV
ncbi:hypothetical protein HQ545_04445 [Candidatus Woesearchaeota archaeon]|nr:hypothetical protein [Candidatus Woesearchaeota archaeon]